MAWPATTPGTATARPRWPMPCGYRNHPWTKAFVRTRPANVGVDVGYCWTEMGQPAVLRLHRPHLPV